MPKSIGLFNIVEQLKTLPSAFNMMRAGKLPPIIHKTIPGVKRIKTIFRTRRRTIQVKVAFYPGCVSKGACPELYVSAKTIAEPLGLELEGADRSALHRRRRAERAESRSRRFAQRPDAGDGREQKAPIS